ncbi:MAG: PilW family protein [Halioglobus sp.]
MKLPNYIAEKQRGMTLVELMIATVLGMFIMLMLTNIYANVSRSNQEMSNVNRHIENARFAMQFLGHDIKHAGYWGGYVPEFDNLTFGSTPSDTPTIIPDPCLAYAAWTAAHVRALIGTPVQAYNAVPGTCGAIVSSKVANTDVLVVRHAEPCIPGTGNCQAMDPDRLYFQYSNCESEIDGGFTMALDPNSFPLRERDCGLPGGDTIAGIRRFVQNIYYIRDYLDSPGDGIPTLMRSEFDVTAAVPAQQAAVPLVEGIDRFRVELGVDSLSDSGDAIDYSAAVTWAQPTNWTSPTNRGDGILDGAWKHCTACTVSDYINTVAIQVHLLARAGAPSPGYTDQKTYTLGSQSVSAFGDEYKRHAYSTTVRLNTVSGRRETP